MLKAYLKEIFEKASQGDAREESYYSCIEDLLDRYKEHQGLKNIHITTLPKKTEAGNPDFRIWDGKQHIVGYIEAKAPPFNSPLNKGGHRGVEHLDQIETTEQLKRYLQTFPNLILTNFSEFRLYRNGELTDRVLISRPFIIHKLKTIPPVEKEAEFFNLLEKFFSFSLPKVYDAKTLAIELAKRTRFLKDEVITQELNEEERKGKGFILGFYEAFRKYLISGLSKEDFADLYSQTITYGLFAARTRSENGFNRKLAYDNIPRTIGILRDVFKFVSLGDLPKQMEWIIDDISEVLSVTDVNKILHQYFHEGKGKDPVVHFYETFLTEYDPQTREKRGVYYTPEPVVSYIVHSLHNILKDDFNRKDGFVSNSVTVLDPAAGTLTFLAEASKLAVDEFIHKYGEGGKEKFIKEHILKNFYAFELIMAPYAVGHLKMSFLLEELGYRLHEDDRFKLYLTNTLEMEELAQTELPGMSSLSEESHLAGKVKKEQPILVILGNPPYSGHSTNIGDWISTEIKAYYKVDGKPLGEKNPKWLQDDYVKFIRFAQWKIDKAGEGVLGFITNHSYLDNPTFRGMRQSLMQSFNEIYILDLHGNSLKKEKCPDGSKDENVFDIQQGVAIALFVKKNGVIARSEIPRLSLRGSQSEPKQSQDRLGTGSTISKREIASPSARNDNDCKVFHTDLWGLREDKYKWLENHNIKNTKWKRLKPKTEFYLFIPRDEKLLNVYESYPKITDIFPVNSVGVVTARDNFVIDFDKEALKRRVRMLLDEKIPDEIIRQTFNLRDKTNWKLKDVRKNVMEDENWEDSITQILYRPFDVQWIFYHDTVIERSRREVMQHMMKENLGLIFHRREELLIPYSHFLVTNNIVEHGCLSSKTTCYLAPLYIYQEKEKPKKQSISRVMMLFEPEAEYGVKKPNLSSKIVEQLTEYFKRTPSPEQIFYYIYAIFYSNIYRTKYAEFLRIDFPRIPFTKDYKLFIKMAEYGKRLVDLHLLKDPPLVPPLIRGDVGGYPAARLQGKGNFKVEKLRYDENRLYINQSQYFEGISKEVYQYQIGGYQVCDKWLKDRKGRSLSLDDIKHYCNIVTSIQKTIEIQKAIDDAYGKIK